MSEQRKRLREISPELWLIPVLLIALVLCLFNLCPRTVGSYHDDGIYVVTAKALATGQGYRIISLPEPLPQTKYPFLYPYLLSLIWRVSPEFPANVLPMKLLSVAASLLFLWLSYRLLSRLHYAAPEVALGVIALSAWCAWTVYYSTMVLSEMTYAFLSVATLYLVETAGHRPTARGRNLFIIAAALLAGTTYLTRSIGLVLAVAIFLYLLLQREWGRSLLFAGLASAVILPWLLWVRILAPIPGLNSMELYYVSYTHWISDYTGGYISLPMLTVFCKNLFYCVSGIMTLSNPVFVYAPLPLGFTIGAAWEARLVVTGLGLAGLAVLAAMHRLRYRPRLLDIYIALYLVAVLLWPWPPLRFLIPVAPFLLLYNIRAGEWLSNCLVRQLPGERLKKLAQASMIGIAASGLLLNLALSAYYVRETWTHGFALPPTAVHPVRSQAEANSDPMTWILRNTPPDATLSAAFDPMFYLYTGRRAVRGFAINPVESFYAAEHSPSSISRFDEIVENWRRFRVSYVILMPDAEPLLAAYLKEALAKRPQWLSLVYKTPEEYIVAFRLNWDVPP